jgi:hypothetical protein
MAGNCFNVARKRHDRLAYKIRGNGLEDLLRELGGHERLDPNVRAVYDLELTRAVSAPAVCLCLRVAAHSERSKVTGNPISELE